MNKVVVFGIVLLSIIPWPALIVWNNDNDSYLLKSPRFVVLFGIIHFWAVLVLTYLLFQRYFRKIDPVLNVFSLFCTDASFSLFTALGMSGFIASNKLPNATILRPYLKTVHGTILSYWNGTVHYILCIAAIALYTNRDSHREVSLYWAGSLLNSMIVVLPASILDAETENVAILVNVVYILVPLTIIIYYIHRRPSQIKTFLQCEPIWKRKMDLLFLLYYLAAIVLSVFRGLAVLVDQDSCLNHYVEVYEPYLRDKSNFPKFQALTYEYLFAAYYLAAMYGLISLGHHWMADWALIHAGAAAQAQFTYILGSIHPLTSKNNLSPKTGMPAVVFWAVNVTLFVVPHLFALWCQKNPDLYGGTCTVELATPLRPYRHVHINESKFQNAKRTQ